MTLKRLNIEEILQISTFSLGRKGCAYYEKSAYYEWAQYIFSNRLKIEALKMKGLVLSTFFMFQFLE